jgi:hypothetical protein
MIITMMMQVASFGHVQFVNQFQFGFLIDLPFKVCLDLCVNLLLCSIEVEYCMALSVDSSSCDRDIA